MLGWDSRASSTQLQGRKRPAEMQHRELQMKVTVQSTTRRFSKSCLSNPQVKKPQWNFHRHPPGSLYSIRWQGGRRKSFRKLCIMYLEKNIRYKTLQGLSTTNSICWSFASISQQVVPFFDYTTPFLKSSAHILYILPETLTLKDGQAKYFQILDESFWLKTQLADFLYTEYREAFTELCMCVDRSCEKNTAKWKPEINIIVLLLVFRRKMKGSIKAHAGL